MKRADKAQRISQILQKRHPDPPIPLDHSSAFTLLVAVLMSAQTTDAQVNKVTPALFRLADTPQAMATLSVQQILSAIKSCGLAPTKAKNIKKLSEKLVQEFDAKVPNTLEELETLPGVGHKTAGVVLIQFFGKVAFPVDTHIHRLAARWGLSRAKNVVQTERDLKKLFPPEDWGLIHLQMIYFGRAWCPAKAHDLMGCPICSWAATKKRIAQEAKGR